MQDGEAGNVQGDGNAAGEQPAGEKMLKSGISAREAARLRWEKERARRAAEEDKAAEAATGQILRWSGSLRVGEIIQALETKARKGDSHAARELRSWLSEYPPTDEAVDLADMPAAMRQKLLKRLVAEVEDEEAASGENP